MPEDSDIRTPEDSDIRTDLSRAVSLDKLRLEQAISAVATANTDNPFHDLMQCLRRLPGIGPRSARRISLYLCEHGGGLRASLAASLRQLDQQLVRCRSCRAMMLADPCHICSRSDRNPQQICVVEQLADLLTFEESRVFLGHYHCLGGVLCAVRGVSPNDLQIEPLLRRIAENAPQEIVMALPLTADGQTTMLYLVERIRSVTNKISISSLAHGIPAGGAVDFLDEGTLAAAFKGRTAIG